MLPPESCTGQPSPRPTTGLSWTADGDMSRPIPTDLKDSNGAGPTPQELRAWLASLRRRIQLSSTRDRELVSSAERAIASSKELLSTPLAAAGDPFSRFHQAIALCESEAAVLQALLGHSMRISGARLGNVQLLNASRDALNISHSAGFADDFLDRFASVNADDGTACGRALLSRSQVMIADVRTDDGFRPFCGIAEASGFRSVQSTPLRAPDGAMVGIVPTHFSGPTLLSKRKMLALDLCARIATKAILRRRACHAIQP